MSAKNVVIDRRDPSVAIIALAGEHESYIAERLRSELSALLDEGLGIVIDLTEATFLDSAVVGVVLDLRRAANERGRKFALVMDDNTGPAVQRLFDLTGLNAVLPIAPSRAAALSA